MLHDDRDHLELENLQIEGRKLMVETRKLRAEEAKLKREAFWYPLLVGAGLITAGSAIISLLSKT